MEYIYIFIFPNLYSFRFLSYGTVSFELPTMPKVLVIQLNQEKNKILLFLLLAYMSAGYSSFKCYQDESNKQLFICPLVIGVFTLAAEMETWPHTNPWTNDHV